MHFCEGCYHFWCQVCEEVSSGKALFRKEASWHHFEWGFLFRLCVTRMPPGTIEHEVLCIFVRNATISGVRFVRRSPVAKQIVSQGGLLAL